MRYLKILSITVYLLSLMTLAGCAEQEQEPVIKSEDGALWLQFELSNSVSDSPGTRATEDDLDKTETEAIIKDAMVLLVDTDESDNDKATVVRGVASGANAKVKYIDGDDGKKICKISANMGLNTVYEREHTYRVYVFANLPAYGTNLTDVIGKPISKVGETIISNLPSYASLTGSAKLAMSSLDADAAKVKVWLEKDAYYYSEDDAYVVKSELNSNADGELALTPLYARLDIVENSGITDFTYPISFKVTDKDNVGAVRDSIEVKVQFKKAKIYNASKDAFILPTGPLALTGTSLKSPESVTFNTSSLFQLQSSTPAYYIPEYVPVVSENSLSYQNTTYIEFYGALVADASCENLDSKVKFAIQNAAELQDTSQPLYYYDDGKIQSGLTTESHAGKANWIELKYDDSVDGYLVKYHYAIVHNKDHLDDGIVNQQEYGVVRNYIYNIGISSVKALPHPWSVTDPVETDKKDISIRIMPPTKWVYHRGGFVITFEK